MLHSVAIALLVLGVVQSVRRLVIVITLHIAVLAVLAGALMLLVLRLAEGDKMAGYNVFICTSGVYAAVLTARR